MAKKIQNYFELLNISSTLKKKIQVISGQLLLGYKKKMYH